MIDGKIRVWIDPTLHRLALGLDKAGITANQVTIVGFLVGLTVIPLLALQQYNACLIVIACNRLADGLDGCLARIQGGSETGAYLDIVLDFIFYSAVVFGFCLAQPEQAIYGALLIFSFVGTGTSFLAFSIFAAKHSITKGAAELKSIYYLGGLTEGFETIVTFVLMCILPEYFWLIAGCFSLLCWITTLTRIGVSCRILGKLPTPS